MKGQKNKREETKGNAIKSKQGPIGETAGIKKKVRQKYIPASVAQKLKRNLVSKPSGVQKKVRFKIESTNTEDTKHKKPRQEVNVASLNVDKKDTETNKSVTNSKPSAEPIISFTKVTKENFGKTLLARKRNIKDTDSKKTLSSIFSKEKESGSGEVNLLGSSREVDTEQDVPKKEAKLIEFKKPLPSMQKVDLGAKKKKKHTEKSANQSVDNTGTYNPHKSSGKVSSLFGHNPEIPNIGQRLVKPINEPVFAATTFTDLNVHPFTVGIIHKTGFLE